MKDISRTYGELRTKKIFADLPSDEFVCFDEPRIDSPNGTVRYPDFVVIVRSRGVLAVEVKDWKKIDIEESDQDRIKVITSYGEVQFINNPVRTVRNYSNNLMDLFEKRRELLRNHQGLEKLRFPCEGIVIFPHLDVNTIQKMEHTGIFPKNMVFPGESLISPEKFIEYLKKISWLWNLQQPMQEFIVEIIRNTLEMKDVKSEKTNQKIGDLNKNQEEIVFSPLPTRDGGFSIDLIRGSVGSGKTIVLTKRAELLAECRPDLNILLTAFQIDLTNDLRRRIPNKKIKVLKFFDICKEILGEKWPETDEYRDERGPTTIIKWTESWSDCLEEECLNGAQVALEIARRKDILLTTEEGYLEDLRRRKENYSREQIELLNVMYELYREYQENSRSEGHEAIDFEDIPDLTLKALFGHKWERSFDVIMIDEAQDWAPKWIQIIKRLLKPGGYLLLCDDPAQSLWRFFNWEQKGIKNPNKYFLELPERTTCQIMTFAQGLFDIDEQLHVGYDMDVYPVKTDHLLQGDKPLVLIYDNIHDEEIDISSRIEAYLSNGISKSDIGILCVNRDDANSWKRNAIIEQNQIYVGHFNLMKGLEFDTVVIPHLFHLFSKKYPMAHGSDHLDLRKLFVAITRAKQNVILSTFGEFPDSISPLLNYATVVRSD